MERVVLEYLEVSYAFDCIDLYTMYYALNNVLLCALGVGVWEVDERELPSLPGLCGQTIGYSLDVYLELDNKVPTALAAWAERSSEMCSARSSMAARRTLSCIYSGPSGYRASSTKTYLAVNRAASSKLDQGNAICGADLRRVSIRSKRVRSNREAI